MLRGADRRAAFETALIAAGLLVLLLVLPHALLGDDTTRFADIEQLIHHGHLTDSNSRSSGRSPRHRFLLIGEVVGTPAWWAARFNVFVVGGSACSRRMRHARACRAPPVRTFALVLLYASFLTERLRNYGPEPFTAALFALGALAVVETATATWLGRARPRRRQHAGAIVALALVAAARMLPDAPASTAARAAGCGAADHARGVDPPWRAADDRLRRRLSFKTFMPYSGRNGFSYPFVLGLVSILFSFGRGLVFFMPGLLLWLGERTRRRVPGRQWVVLQLLFVAGLVLVYSKWWAWYGGDAWGPRFFVAAAVPAVSLPRRPPARRSRERLGRRRHAGALCTLRLGRVSTGALENNWLSGVCAQNNFRTPSRAGTCPSSAASGGRSPTTHPPTAANLFLAGYCFAVFAYLAAPTVREFARALSRAAVDLGPPAGASIRSPAIIRLRGGSPAGELPAALRGADDLVLRLEPRADRRRVRRARHDGLGHRRRYLVRGAHARADRDAARRRRRRRPLPAARA